MHFHGRRSNFLVMVVVEQQEARSAAAGRIPSWSFFGPVRDRPPPTASVVRILSAASRTRTRTRRILLRWTATRSCLSTALGIRGRTTAAARLEGSPTRWSWGSWEDGCFGGGPPPSL